MIHKIKLRQDIIRGGKVNPEIYCKQGELCVDRPEYYTVFNKAILGTHCENIKYTITQDTVDCGLRKIVEEIKLCKYNDYEVFTFSQFIKEMRKKLEDDIFLRVHIVNNYTFDRENTLTVEQIQDIEHDMDES